jgi:two-component system, OmpR family, alkaline phosphatase synthesis response regulator PhoP
MSHAGSILVVDDESFIRRSLTYILAREGYAAASAADGPQALGMIRELRPVMVFLDVMMPGMDGYEVCRAIKGDPTLRGTCIVLLTARGEEIDRGEGLAAGADEYMTKPYSPSRVLALVRDVVGWPEEVPAGPPRA